MLPPPLAGTGAIDDIGFSKGKHYTVNVPLKDGMDDESYRMMFEPIMAKVRQVCDSNSNFFVKSCS